MILKSGVATITFDSGAEITMEAPCEIDIQHPMRAKLYQGNVIVKAPESMGFILETPDGCTVDNRTSFGVFANGPRKETSFNVLKDQSPSIPNKVNTCILIRMNLQLLQVGLDQNSESKYRYITNKTDGNSIKFLRWKKSDYHSKQSI